MQVWLYPCLYDAYIGFQPAKSPLQPYSREILLKSAKLLEERRLQYHQPVVDHVQHFLFCLFCVVKRREFHKYDSPEGVIQEDNLNVIRARA